MRFSMLLKHYRELAGLTQAVVAKAIGVFPQHINGMEAGRRFAATPRLYKLVRVLRVPEAEMERFLFYAAIAHIPDRAAQDYVASYFERQETAIRQRLQVHDTLNDRVKVLESLVNPPVSRVRKPRKQSHSKQ